ncbi:hypothetical protein EJ08DRAFT_593457 [Tothia fuscella]|uniref:SH3 domain-containing protein n=1 Tax=Tothia fuscella TaxID=1048955 RepID=A0A9P4NLJ3_9PEZI|nr:hypothetical protein EJ08DRAFT_593457 [Tothia fuscella]
MQRRFGAMLARTADDAQVGMLIHDFESADKMLETLIEASKHWRDSWADILNRQSAILSDYDLLYSPIVGSDGNEDGNYSVTPKSQLDRVHYLKEFYMELKTDMLEEVSMVDKRIIEPAKDARMSLKTYKKVIKKREDKKLDYERYRGRVDSVEKKNKRTDRENVALAKHNVDLGNATAVCLYTHTHLYEYHAADDELKATLPSMTNAAYSLLPPLLNAQIMIQNTLLGQLYTTLHNYSQDHGFPSPPPEMPEIIAIFEGNFTPLRLEAESSLRMLAMGKAIHQPMTLDGASKSYSGMNIRNNAGNAISSRRGNSSNNVKPAAIMGKPSPTSPHPPPAPPSDDQPELPHLYSDMKTNPDTRGGWRKPSDPNLLSPQTSHASHYSQNAYGGANPSPPASVASSSNHDYFPPSAAHIANMKPRPSITSMSSSTSLASSIAAKKKPPPPPPAKRIPSQQFEYVTALYDFTGEGPGDLSFREGDRIKIIKKTGSEQDWWDGELRGVKGAFPANYCK